MEEINKKNKERESSFRVLQKAMATLVWKNSKQ